MPREVSRSERAYNRVQGMNTEMALFSFLAICRVWNNNSEASKFQIPRRWPSNIMLRAEISAGHLGLTFESIMALQGPSRHEAEAS